MEEIINSKKRKREIRNEKLRKARHAKFEKRQRVEKISQFRRIADFELIVKQLEEGCQKCMSSPLLLTDYSRSKLLPKHISLPYYHHQPPVCKHKQSTPSL